MKLTLIGRPGKMEMHGQAVVFRMQGKPLGNFPKGLLPVPIQAALIWNILVAIRQSNSNHKA